jgi:hypothetical protein
MDQPRYLVHTQRLLKLFLDTNDYKSAYFLLLRVLENSKIDYYEEFSANMLNENENVD